MSEAPTVPTNGNGHQQQEPAQQQSILTRSWHAIFSPFSPSALATLPNLQRPARYLRLDDIPETATDGEGQQPTVRDYHAINSVPPQVRVPKKIPTSVKVESKVWFANERTWVSWLNISVLLAALALGLFNASKDDIARRMAYVYAVISICVLIYGYALYQHRITMIRRRDPGHFDALAGPILLSIALFVAVLANFILRVREMQRKQIPFPGDDLLAFLAPKIANLTPLSYSSQQHF
ncbi:hypothetical protein K443DRAFT_680965 [Laccaria amethystina LaAM-08-1]|uniref:DUF202 domain-containing protein n=1 Tax=Laccaria amethystina LaAM-08-1 TaxID=1095629 RepID=A0A0C9X9Q9_9AGAR|nr:hypothetical protein K443DRAFT_680965 [Laccaria amethystina LaAM-08-1]